MAWSPARCKDFPQNTGGALVLGRSSVCHSGEFHRNRDPLVTELEPPFSHLYQCRSEVRISLVLVNTIFLFFSVLLKSLAANLLGGFPYSCIFVVTFNTKEHY